MLIWSIRPGLFFFLPRPKALCPEVLAVAMPLLLWSWVRSTSLYLLAGGVRLEVGGGDDDRSSLPTASPLWCPLKCGGRLWRCRPLCPRASWDMRRGGGGVLGALWLGARHSSALYWFVSVAAALCEGPARPLFHPICFSPVLQEQRGSSPQACAHWGHCWVAELVSFLNGYSHDSYQDLRSDQDVCDSRHDKTRKIGSKIKKLPVLTRFLNSLSICIFSTISFSNFLFPFWVKNKTKKQKMAIVEFFVIFSFIVLLAIFTTWLKYPENAVAAAATTASRGNYVAWSHLRLLLHSEFIHTSGLYTPVTIFARLFWVCVCAVSVPTVNKEDLSQPKLCLQTPV